MWAQLPSDINPESDLLDYGPSGMVRNKCWNLIWVPLLLDIWRHQFALYKLHIFSNVISHWDTVESSSNHIFMKPIPFITIFIYLSEEMHYSYWDCFLIWTLTTKLVLENPQHPLLPCYKTAASKIRTYTNALCQGKKRLYIAAYRLHQLPLLFLACAQPQS